MSTSYLVRPTTAGSYFNKNKNQLGSNCPTIVKHENFEPFYQPMRAPSASNLHRPATSLPKNSRPELLNHESFKMLTSNEMTADIRKKLRPLSSTLINSMRSDVFIKHFNEESLKNFKNVVKPVQKLDTYSIHSTLYKIKKEREELDHRIQELEATKKDFRENEICLIANSGAVDYIINLNARVNPESASNQLLMSEKNDTLNTREMKKRLMESSRQNIKAQMSLNGTMKNSITQNNNEMIVDEEEISGIRGTTTMQRPQTAGIRPSTAKSTQIDFRKMPKQKSIRSANKVASFQSNGPQVNFGVTGERANIYQIYLAYNEVELKGGRKGSANPLGRSASQKKPLALNDQDSFEHLIPSSSGRQIGPEDLAKLSMVQSPTGDNITVSTTLQAGSTGRPQSAKPQIQGLKRNWK